MSTNLIEAIFFLVLGIGAALLSTIPEVKNKWYSDSLAYVISFTLLALGCRFIFPESFGQGHSNTLVMMACAVFPFVIKTVVMFISKPKGI